MVTSDEIKLVTETTTKVTEEFFSEVISTRHTI